MTQEERDAAIARARQSLERSAKRFNELCEVFENFPEPKCTICGRVIYCGDLEKMCGNIPCGLKKD